MTAVVLGPEGDIRIDGKCLGVERMIHHVRPSVSVQAYGTEVGTNVRFHVLTQGNGEGLTSFRQHHCDVRQYLCDAPPALAFHCTGGCLIQAWLSKEYSDNPTACCLTSAAFSPSPHFSPVGEMIAQRFGFTRNFLKERNT